MSKLIIKNTAGISDAEAYTLALNVIQKGPNKNGEYDNITFFGGYVVMKVRTTNKGTNSFQVIKRRDYYER